MRDAPPRHLENVWRDVRAVHTPEPGSQTKEHPSRTAPIFERDSRRRDVEAPKQPALVVERLVSGVRPDDVLRVVAVLERAASKIRPGDQLGVAGALHVEIAAGIEAHAAVLRGI